MPRLDVAGVVGQHVLWREPSRNRSRTRCSSRLSIAFSAFPSRAAARAERPTCETTWHSRRVSRCTCCTSPASDVAEEAAAPASSSAGHQQYPATYRGQAPVLLHPLRVPAAPAPAHPASRNPPAPAAAAPAPRPAPTGLRAQAPCSALSLPPGRAAATATRSAPSAPAPPASLAGSPSRFRRLPSAGHPPRPKATARSTPRSPTGSGS